LREHSQLKRAAYFVDRIYKGARPADARQPLPETLDERPGDVPPSGRQES
jgi:hypothetical protein